MIPLTAKESIELFIAQSGYAKSDDIELIIKLYYDELNRKMETLECDNLEMLGVGHWFIKVWTLKRTIFREKGLLNAISGKKYEFREKRISFLQGIYERVVSRFDKNIKIKIARRKKKKAKKE